MMKKHSSAVRKRVVHAVKLWLRQLLDEVRLLLVGFFPRFRDAFDADELPVPFILERDARRSEGMPGRRGGGYGKQVSDD